MIPDELIEQVRDSADIVSLIGEVVPLKKTGADWRGPCPFHGGTHRNFAVIPKKGLYYCYVCHAAGDVFTFLMKRGGLDYPTAVREVAKRVNIAIPEPGARSTAVDHREPLFGAMAVAQEWFAARLREGADAREAREYLEGRDIPMPTAAELGLGYAPKDRSLLAALGTLGLTEATMVDAGLVVRRDDGTIYPRFRGRLLFPIRDLRGRVVGFGGRTLGAQEPKYLNSPESSIFHKGSSLYNLHQAKNAIRKEGVAIVVEGYFDVVRLVLGGIEHVVAPLGTALTADQAALLKRFAPTVILLYDADTAGLKATFRTGDECLRHGLRVKVATLPPGKDPDTLVQQEGTGALVGLLDDAVDVLERKIQLLERKGWFASLERRREALDRLMPTLRATSDPVARDLYLGLVSERVGVTRQVLEDELRAVPSHSLENPANAPGRPRSQVAEVDRRVPSAQGRAEAAVIEGKLLGLLIQHSAWLDRARSEVSATMFEVPAFREIFEALLSRPTPISIEQLGAALSPRAGAAFQRIVDRRNDPIEGDQDTLYASALARLEQRSRLRELPPASDVAARKVALADLDYDAIQRLHFRKSSTPARNRPPDGRPRG